MLNIKDDYRKIELMQEDTNCCMNSLYENNIKLYRAIRILESIDNKTVAIITTELHEIAENYSGIAADMNNHIYNGLKDINYEAQA